MEMDRRKFIKSTLVAGMTAAVSGTLMNSKASAKSASNKKRKENAMKPHQGSRKNKFTFSGVEAPAWQGAEAQEYQDISALWQHRQAGCIGA